MRVQERERERKTERETQRERDRERQRGRETEKDREREREHRNGVCEEERQRKSIGKWIKTKKVEIRKKEIIYSNVHIKNALD